MTLSEPFVSKYTKPVRAEPRGHELRRVQDGSPVGRSEVTTYSFVCRGCGLRTTNLTTVAAHAVTYQHEVR